MFVSAVASSTAVGTFETWMPREVQAGTSTWSYPAPRRGLVAVLLKKQLKNKAVQKNFQETRKRECKVKHKWK